VGCSCTEYVRMKSRPPAKQQWLYSRAQAAELLGCAVDLIKDLEQDGKLTPIKLTEKPKSMVFYKREELLALCGVEAAA